MFSFFRVKTLYYAYSIFLKHLIYCLRNRNTIFSWSALSFDKCNWNVTVSSVVPGFFSRRKITETSPNFHTFRYQLKWWPQSLYKLFRNYFRTGFDSFVLLYYLKKTKEMLCVVQGITIVVHISICVQTCHTILYREDHENL